MNLVSNASISYFEFAIPWKIAGYTGWSEHQKEYCWQHGHDPSCPCPKAVSVKPTFRDGPRKITREVAEGSREGVRESCSTATTPPPPWQKEKSWK